MLWVFIVGSIIMEFISASIRLSTLQSALANVTDPRERGRLTGGYIGGIIGGLLIPVIGLVFYARSSVRAQFTAVDAPLPKPNTALSQQGSV
jgi:MFS family permease